MTSTAMKIYHVGGIYYSVLASSNCGPGDLGKQLADDVPADLNDIEAWRRLKIDHFLEENARLVPGQSLGNSDSDGAYCEQPTAQYPSIPRQVCWLYTIDVDNDTFSVSLVDYSTRVFSLTNIPRGLFQSSAVTPAEDTWMGDAYHVFIDPVSHLHLAPATRPTEPDPALVALYHSFAPKLRPLHPLPSVDTFPLRKYLRLLLLKHFFSKHQAMFGYVNNRRYNIFINMFHRLAYSIINLARSAVEINFVIGARTPYATRNIIDSGYLPPTTEYWIDGVLIVLEREISTTENFHAAVGKAIQIVRASECPPSEGTIPSAVICSLSAIVLVYIQGEDVSHTRHLHFFPHHTIYEQDEAQTEGVLALLDILYRPPPSPPAVPQSFPGPYKHLPTEICRDIFFHASPSTRNELQASCRLFRGISQDYGVRVGDCYLQQRSAEHGDSAFIGSFEHYESRDRDEIRTICTRRTVLYLIQQCSSEQSNVVGLRLPDSQLLTLVLPVIAGGKTEGFPPAPPVAPWAR